MKILIKSKKIINYYNQLYSEYIGKKGIDFINDTKYIIDDTCYFFLTTEEIHKEHGTKEYINFYPNVKFMIEINKHGCYKDITIIDFHDINKLK